MRSYPLHHGTGSIASGIQHPGHLAEISTRKRERVGRACDACRIKKSKCDGNKPCSRCIADHKVCIFTSRKCSTDKLYPGNYVELLHNRIEVLQLGLELLVQRINRGDAISCLLDDMGKININMVLDKLSVSRIGTDHFSVMERSSPSSSMASSGDGDDVDENEDVEWGTGQASERRRDPEDELVHDSGLHHIPLETEKYGFDHTPHMTASGFDSPNRYPMSAYSAFSSYYDVSDTMSVASSPAISSSLCPSPNLEFLHLRYLSLSPTPYSQDLLPPQHTFDFLQPL
ncbi:hypothetical protein V1506DRAFT_549644 [Lipomyces tetrasporus]